MIARRTALAVSAAALVFVASWEQFREIAYDDGVGVQTVGWGTTSGRAETWDRNHPVLLWVASQAGITEQQLDQLFIDGAGL